MEIKKHKRYLIVFLLSSLQLINTVHAAKEFKLAYSKEHKVDVYTNSENWCNDNVPMELYKEDDNVDEQALLTLSKKIIKVITTQCEQVKQVDINTFNADGSKDETFIAKADANWQVVSNTPVLNLDEQEVVEEDVAEEDVAEEDVAEEEVAEEEVAEEEVAEEEVAEEDVVKEEVAKEVVAKEDAAKEKAITKPAELSFKFYGKKDPLITTKDKSCGYYAVNFKNPEELEYLYLSVENDIPSCPNGLITGEYTISVKYIDGRVYTHTKANFVDGFMLEDKFNKSYIKPVSRFTYKPNDWSENEALYVYVGYIDELKANLYAYYNAGYNSVWHYKNLVLEYSDEATFLDGDKLDAMAKTIGEFYMEKRIKQRHYGIYLDFYVVKQFNANGQYAADDYLYKSQIYTNNKQWALRTNQTENYVYNRLIEKKKTEEQRVAAEKERKRIEEERIAAEKEQQRRRRQMVSENMAEIEAFLRTDANIFDKAYLVNEPVINKFIGRRNSLFENTFNSNAAKFPYAVFKPPLQAAMENYMDGRDSRTFSFIQTDEISADAPLALAWPENLYLQSEAEIKQNQWYIAMGTSTFNDDNNIVLNADTLIPCEQEKCEEYNDNQLVLNKINQAVEDGAGE